MHRCHRYLNLAVLFNCQLMEPLMDLSLTGLNNGKLLDNYWPGKRPRNPFNYEFKTKIVFFAYTNIHTRIYI